MYPRGQRHTAVSPPVVKHFPPWEHGTLLHLSAVHSSETTINQTDQWSTRSALSTWMIRQTYGITYSEKSFDKNRRGWGLGLHYYARSKNIGRGEMEEGGVLVFGFVYPTVDRQYRRCKYLTKIRRLSFSALFVPRVSTAVRSRKPVRCLRNYLPPRSFDSIGNFRRMKSVFLFPSFFPFPPPSPVLLLFCFLFPIGRLGIGSRRLSRKSIATTRLSISRAEKYRRGILIVDAFVAPLFPRAE